MYNPVNRIGYLSELYDKYNEEEFGGKLTPVTLLIQRNERAHGWHDYKAHGNKDDAPIRSELKRATIVISEMAFDEDEVEGTLLHEMIHHYQAVVLNRQTNHDAIFCSIARRLERKYGISVR